MLENESFTENASIFHILKNFNVQALSKNSKYTKKRNNCCIFLPDFGS